MPLRSCICALNFPILDTANASFSLGLFKYVASTESPRRQHVPSSLFLLVLPPSAGIWRQGVRDKRQPVRSFIQFTPPANIGCSGHEEVNGPLKFMLPILCRSNGAIPRIDINSGACRDHRGQCAVSLSDDAPQVRCQGLTIFRPEQCCLIGGLVRSVREQIFCLGPQSALG